MWSKSPRLCKNEQSEDSQRSKKGSPRVSYNKTSINSQFKKRRSSDYGQRMQKKKHM